MKMGAYGIKKNFKIFIIEIVQFTILFVLIGQGISYFEKINVKEYIQNKKDAYYYYTLYTNSANSSKVDLDDPFLLGNMNKALLEIREEKEFLYTALSLSDFIEVDTNELNQHFGQDVYSEKVDFLAYSEYPGYYIKHPELRIENETKTDNRNYTYVSGVRMDQNAFDHYKLEVEKGIGFASNDYVCNLQNENVAVLVGAEYYPYYDVGDQIPFYLNEKKFMGTIKGILERNTFIKNDETFEHLGMQEKSLDHSIIIPYFTFEGKIESSLIKDFVKVEYINQLTGTLVFADRTEIEKIEKNIIDINQHYVNNHIFTVQPSSATNGYHFFQSENSIEMKWFLILICGVYCLYLLCLFICVSYTIKINLYTHAVQMLLGINKKDIIRFYIIRYTIAYVSSLYIVLLIYKEWLYQGLKFWVMFLALLCVLFFMNIYYIKSVLQKQNLLDIFQRRG